MRRFLIFFLIIIGFTIILIRLFLIQINNHHFFSELADNQQMIKSTVNSTRGQIIAIDPKSNRQKILATNKKFWDIYAVPQKIKNPENTARQLASILSLNEKKIIKRINRPNDPYEPIKNRVDDQKWKEIKQLKLNGIYAKNNYWRWYPQKEFFSHILGFWGENKLGAKGMYGLEELYDSHLSGKSGSVLLGRDALGKIIWTHRREIENGQNGDDLVLTVDPNIQYFVTDELKKAVEKWKADSGCAVVMNPHTGAILAMESWPFFDPNQYGQVKNESFYLNSCIQRSFEPGSVMKPITMAAAINEGKVTPDTTYIDKGYVKMDGYKIKNAANEIYGESDMSKVLEKSINTGAVFAEEKLGPKLFRQYLEKFGFGKKTNIDLSGEVSGSITNLQNLSSKVNFATASFGQGIMVTPIQMINAIAAIANYGKLMKPYIVKEIIHPNGQKEGIKPKIVRQVISPKTAKTVSLMLANVVKKGYPWIKIGQTYSVAGKTGTAQVSWAYLGKNKRGYSDQTIHSFIIFAPAKSPKFIFYIKLDNPKKINFAANSLSYFVGDLTRKLLDYYEISPN
ncbi:MAG TPA: penicillin-binding protein 2 [Candidatus Portnoybacteria bacterium]|nr:penicillin-binding protein 2 [Candidatus Portnoybacteria bacterium]